MPTGFFADPNAFIDQFLVLAGNDPFSAMVYLFLNGGWIVALIALLYGAKWLWLDYIQTKNIMAREFILLRVAVPRSSEQTPKATENMFAAFAGAHAPRSWAEKWIQGDVQSPITIEIASIEGDVSYYIHCLRKMRDLVEASIYAQYPDADIHVAPDYTKGVPGHFPDEAYDLWGTEMIPVRKEPYPLKTYRDFEDAVSGEFKDPMAILLEVFSRLGPGEQAWYQITCTPTEAPEARKICEKLIDKIKGVKKEPKKTVLDSIVSFPITLAQEVLKVLLASPTEVVKKKPDNKELFPRMMALSPGERDALEAVERKGSKILYDCKVRIIYVAKKEVMVKSHIANPFIGAIKQTNTAHMQSLKPESKKVGVNGTLWWFKDQRNNLRKTKLMTAYRLRSNWKGMPNFFLSTEELATLWHFPILIQVKAPQLLRTQAKKSEAPANLPYGM